MSLISSAKRPFVETDFFKDFVDLVVTAGNCKPDTYGNLELTHSKEVSVYF